MLTPGAVSRMVEDGIKNIRLVVHRPTKTDITTRINAGAAGVLSMAILGQLDEFPREQWGDRFDDIFRKKIADIAATQMKLTFLAEGDPFNIDQETFDDMSHIKAEDFEIVF